MRVAVIPSEARNPCSITMPSKEKFLTSQTPPAAGRFGMTNSRFFSRLLGLCGRRRLRRGRSRLGCRCRSRLQWVRLIVQLDDVLGNINTR